MNFTEFSFWWTLCVVGLPLAATRFLLIRLGFRLDVLDRVVLAVLSLGLFFNASAPSFVILCIEIMVNFGALRLSQKLRGRARTALVVVVATGDLLVLAYFKYLGFFLGDFLNVVTMGAYQPNFGPVAAGVPAIPPGISFYTFQMVAMLIDTYRNPKASEVKALDYLNFASFFPQIVAGPIERREGLLPQIEKFRFRFDSRAIDEGFRWLILGFFLKLVLADNLAAFVHPLPSGGAPSVLLTTYLFGLRIYFDFAGYSFVALGIARCIGVKLTLNFLAPYSSLSIREFWHRWHVTLSRWFRDYLFIPIGGSRVSFWAVNILVVFAVSGLWHGAGWNFVLWGVYHGTLLVLQRMLTRPEDGAPPAGRLGNLARWASTYLLAMFGWIFFMEPDWSQLSHNLMAVVDPSAYSLQAIGNILGNMGRVDLAVLGLALVMAHAVILVETVSVRAKPGENPYRILLKAPVVALMLVALFTMTARQPSQFIYFAF